jgi:hypothetical protein
MNLLSLCSQAIILVCLFLVWWPSFLLLVPGFTLVAYFSTSSCFWVTIWKCYSSGDRTPKQKVKMKVTQDRLLNLMLKYNGGRPRAEVCLPSPLSVNHSPLLGACFMSSWFIAIMVTNCIWAPLWLHLSPYLNRFCCSIVVRSIGES